MKFSATVFTTVVGLTALVSAMPQNSITPAPAGATPATFDAAYSSTLSCIRKCNPGDVYCQAGCQGLPVPDAGALNATHDCVAACPPGGDAEKNAAWAICQQNCVSSLYYSASVPYSSYVPPTAVGFSSDAVVTTPAGGDETTAEAPAATEATEGGSSTKGGSKPTDEATKTTGTGTGPAPTQSPNAGSYMIANMPMLGALSLFLAALAL